MSYRSLPAWLAFIAILMSASDVLAQRGRGPGRGQNDAAFHADREIFQTLLRSRAKIRRSVKNLENGVETVTESDDATVAAYIKKHVAAMHLRIEQGRPIHRRDPLFDELFRNADKIEMKVKETPQGVRVVETSDDSHVASLIQEHAKVVSLFVQRGHSEVRKNHPIPKRDKNNARE